MIFFYLQDLDDYIYCKMEMRLEREQCLTNTSDMKNMSQNYPTLGIF